MQQSDLACKHLLPLFSWGNVTHCGSWRKDDRGERCQIKLVTTNKTTINCQPRNRALLQWNNSVFHLLYNCGQKSFFFSFFGTVIVKSAFWRATCTLNRAKQASVYKPDQTVACSLNFVLFIFLHTVTSAREK